ncbi:MAG: hypothetical protein QM831_04155 [Kofleriaceae bacterium]
MRTKRLSRKAGRGPVAPKRVRRPSRPSLVEQDPGLLVVVPRSPAFGAARHRRLVTATPGSSRVIERVREAISAGKPVSLVALVRRK